MHANNVSVDIKTFGIRLKQDKDLDIFDDRGKLATISISDPSSAQISDNEFLAYIPRYEDAYGSNLAGIFINLEKVYPCIADIMNWRPECIVLSNNEPGFRNGKAILEIGNYGKRLDIFGDRTSVFGIAIQDCPEITDECFTPSMPNGAFSELQIKVMCFLPSDECSEA